MITLALSKGRIFDETLPLLAAAGIGVDPAVVNSRKLILPTDDPGLRLIIVRASDVPTYVQYGAADLGVAGRDVLLEHGGDGLYQPIDLGIARCRMSVAAREGFDYASAVRRGARLRIATKYVRCAREHFAAKGVHVDLVKLYGSMELAPLVGLADAIVDLVSTGSTLKANQLVEVEQLMPIAARMIVNQASMKTRSDELDPLLASLQRAVDSMHAQQTGSAQASGDPAEPPEASLALPSAVNAGIDQSGAGQSDAGKSDAGKSGSGRSGGDKRGVAA